MRWWNRRATTWSSLPAVSPLRQSRPTTSLRSSLVELSWGWCCLWKESWWAYYLNDKNYDEKAEIDEKSLKCRFSAFWSLMVTFSGQWRHRRRTSPLSLASLSRICRFTVGKCPYTGFPMLQNLIGQIMMWNRCRVWSRLESVRLWSRKGEQFFGIIL